MPRSSNRKFKVLLAAHQALAVGGIGRVAQGLARNLPEALEPDVELTVPQPSRSSRSALSRLRGTGSLARLTYEQVSLARLSRSFDLLHLCDIRPIIASHTSSLITVHDVGFLDRPEWTTRAGRAYKAGMLRLAIGRRSTHVVCVSRHTCERLQAHFPRLGDDRIRFVHPGVDRVEPTWNGGGDRPYLLTVGTIEPRKNHLGLLAAFRRARSRRDLRWVVAGSPGQMSRPILTALAAEPGVDVVGPVSEGRLEELYRDALFVATPSLLEGFGYPVLEAMARGVPTVTSNAASLPEVVEDGGPLIDPSHVEGWAEAIDWLARDGAARTQLSRSGLERARQFSWASAARKIADCYREIRTREGDYRESR